MEGLAGGLGSTVVSASSWLSGPLRAVQARPVFANSVALIVLRAANLATRLGLLFLVARLVDPAEFGRAVFALSLVEIAKVLSDFGMDTLAIREYAWDRQPLERTRFAATLATAKVMFGVVAYAVLAVYFLRQGSREQMVVGLVLGLSTFTALLTNYSLDYFQARLRVIEVVPRVLGINLVLAITAAFVLPHLPSLRWQVVCFPAIELACGLALLEALRREPWWQRPKFAPGAIVGLLQQSLPIGATAIVIMTYSRMDVLVLSSRLGEAAVGFYGIAFRVTEPFQIAAAAFGLSVFSRFSTLFQTSTAAGLRPLAARYLGATFGYGTLTAAALMLVAPPLVSHWLPAYAEAIPILRILAGALVFRTLNATLAGILQGAGRFRILTGFAVWNLVLTYGLLVWLVPKHGAAGAAWAALVGEAFNMVLHFALVLRTIAARERTMLHGD